MSFKQKLLYNIFYKWIKPEIISYTDRDSKLVSGTGVSNMTHISNRKNIQIGNDVFIGHFNYIDGFDSVKIGAGSQITNYVSILTHSSHDSLRLDSKGVNQTGLVSGKVEIGEYCYIGAHTVIMPNTKLGKGCIVSAYSYVSGEFPDYSILRGQPAKIIGSTKSRDDAFLEAHPAAKSTYYEKV